MADRDWTLLLREPEVLFQGWAAKNGNKPKFYVGGIGAAMGLVMAPDAKTVWKAYTDTGGGTTKSGRMILQQETNWVEELPFKWEQDLNDPQFRKAINGEPLLFFKAVQVILCFEAYARQRNLPDIYDVIDIIPACYNLDDFNAALLEQLMKADAEFLAKASESIGQPEQFVTDLANGMCGTKASVEALKTFVDEAYPKHKTGAVRPHPGKKKLGSLAASAAERVETDSPSPTPVSAKPGYWRVRAA